MMLFNKLLQTVPILSFSVNADMPVGMLPIDFDPSFNQAVIPLLFAVSSYADDSFFQAGTPFWGEKGKKFGMTQAFFTSFQLSASCCVRTTSASSFFTASSCFFLQCRAICLYGNPRCSIRCRLRVYGLAIWDSPIFTLPSSSCVRKSNSRPNVLMTISGFKVFSQYSSFFLYRYIRVK